MEEKQQRIDRVVDIFTQIFTVYEKRMEYAYASRQRLIDEIERGEVPTGYRFKFLNQSVDRVIDLLADIAEEFNTVHPHDRCTVHDFLDIIETLKYRIEKHAKDDE